MIEDGRQVEPETVLEADLAIVGSGAAGLSLALSLSRKQPRLNILIVEGGGRRFDFDEQTRFFAGAGELDTGHPPLELYRRRMLGGTTSIWGGRCIPMSEDDFEPNRKLGRVGWPVPYRNVARYYPQALDILEAGAHEFSAAEALRDEPAALGPAKSGSGLILDRLERFSPPTDLGQTQLRALENSSNIRILIYASCIEILTDKAGTTAEGLALRAAGNSFSAKARKIVVAAGGLETPRLLLCSRRAKRCGLGNEHSHVGRNYMTHYSGELGQIRFSHPPDRLRLGYSKSHDGVWCRRLILLDATTRRKNGIVNFVFRPTIPAIHDASHGSPVLSAAYFAKRFLIQEYARRLAAMPPLHGAQAERSWMSHAANIATGSPELMRFSAEWIRKRVLPRRKLPSLFLPRKDGIYPLEFNIEELPDPASRVRLTDEVDPNGVPRISVSWRVPSGFPEQLLRIYDTFGNATQKTGLGLVELSEHERERAIERCQSQGGHHIGATRMSASRSTGVVDRNLQVWGTRGLYVLGSSVFPTSGFANPTLTIVALALRLADHIAAENSKSTARARSRTATRTQPSLV